MLKKHPCLFKVTTLLLMRLFVDLYIETLISSFIVSLNLQVSGPSENLPWVFPIIYEIVQGSKKDAQCVFESPFLNVGSGV